MFRILLWKWFYTFLQIGKRLTKNRGKKIWYFAYGANLDPKVMYRRDIEVFAREEYLLKNFRLQFTHPAMFKGMAYADIRQAEGEECFGVLYLISWWDAYRMDCSEGVLLGRHYRKWLHENGKDFYYYEGNEIMNDVSPSHEYYLKIKNCYDAAKIKSSVFEKSITNIKTLESIPQEFRDSVFLLPKKHLPHWMNRLILLYDRLMVKQIMRGYIKMSRVHLKIPNSNGQY